MVHISCVRFLSMAALVVFSAALLVQAADADYKGKIKSASSSRIVIATVAQGGITFGIGDQTEITISGKPAGPRDLKPGDFVRVSATESDGGILLATKIAVSR